MVSRRRRRSFLTALALYTLAAMFIGYFGVHAYTGNHGLRAQQALETQFASLNEELAQARAERATWEHRVSLLRSDRLDPDMLEERARALLHYVHPNDITLLLKPR